MAKIEAVPLERALGDRGRRQPGARAVRRQQFDADAVAVIRAVHATGAAAVDVTGEDPRRYLAGLRRALARAGKDELALRRRPRTTQIVVWRMRPEDKVVQERRRAWGAELAARFWGERRTQVRPNASMGRGRGRSSRIG